MDICSLDFTCCGFKVKCDIWFPQRLKQSRAHRPLCIVCLGASHVHRQAKDKLVEGQTSLCSPFKLIHCLHEGKVFILLGAFDNERPGPEFKIKNAQLVIFRIKVFHVSTPLQHSKIDFILVHFYKRRWPNAKHWWNHQQLPEEIHTNKEESFSTKKFLVLVGDEYYF